MDMRNRALSVYVGTKAALIQHSRNLAVELGQYGIRVNAISLGRSKQIFRLFF